MNKLFCFVLLIFSLSCRDINTSKKNAILSITEKSFDFGEIKLNNKLNHTFRLKNVSNNDLIISNIGTSCSCTQVGKTKEIIKSGDSAEINIEFIPKLSQVGTVVKNTIVVEANTEPPFTVFYLKGKVVK